MSNTHVHLGFLLITAVFHFLFRIMFYAMVGIILPEVGKKS